MRFLEKFACPKCGANLEAESNDLCCRECRSTYAIKDGVCSFMVDESSHGEFDRETMQKILSFARENGWRRAVDEIIKPIRPRVVQLITGQERDLSIAPITDGGECVLDFGSGYGGVSRALAKKFDKVIALDGSMERVSFLSIMIEQDKIENIQPVCHSQLLHLPFSKNAFDAVVMVGVFEYLPLSLPDMTIAAAHKAFLQSLLNILKPGGRLLIHSKNRFGWNYLLGGRDHNGIRFGPALPVAVSDMAMRLSGRGRYRIVNYSNRQYRKILRNAGFEVAKMFWPVPGYQNPNYLVDLDGNVPQQLAGFEPGYNSRSKQAAFGLLARTGLLPHFVPNLGILAVKPR
ncbi:MAG: class I SAM-dependent methyltransferase [Alphaproteobacteria bacterium]